MTYLAAELTTRDTEANVLRGCNCGNGTMFLEMLQNYVFTTP